MTMSTNTALSDDDLNVIELSDSPGRRLRVQRQSKGLEVPRVAAQLHLRPQVVEALEQDRYADLPDPVFVAGYLRNYARLLGLDPDPLVAAYRVAAPVREPPAPSRSLARPRREMGSGHILVRLVSLALIGGVIAMLVLWWQNRVDLLSEISGEGAGSGTGLVVAPWGGERAGGNGSGEPDGGSAPPGDGGLLLPDPAPTAPVLPASLPPPSLPASGSAVPAEPKPLPRGPTEPVAAPAPQNAPQSAPQTGPTADAAPAAGAAAPADTAALEPVVAADRVTLRFSGPCWIDVRDRSGKAILSGEMKKGDERELKGEPPYSFVVGNVRSTAISVGDRPFDLESRSKGNVARFKLDPGATIE